MIYLDHAASSPLLPAAWDAMKPWALAAGNPASSHAFGRAARKALDDARDRIAHRLDCNPDEVLFTSGATEANNLALFGLPRQPGTILASPIEHPCVGEPIQKLVELGHTLQPLTVRGDGVVELPAVVPAGVQLAALMLVNHETGALQPVRELRALMPGVPFHCDAAAAVGRVPVSFRQLGVSTMTLSGHKFHGPQGIGVLVVKKGTRLVSRSFGGHQQHGKRPGTEAVALAVGLATALDWAVEHLERHRDHAVQLRETFVQLLRRDASPIVVNSPADASPFVINVSFPGLSADALLMALDLAGIACSTGSACSSGSLLPSPVLKAMGVPGDVLHSAMRFSMSPLTTLTEVIEAASRIVKCVHQLRRVSEDGDE